VLAPERMCVTNCNVRSWRREYVVRELLVPVEWCLSLSEGLMRGLPDPAELGCGMLRAVS
jgi:hypothetical protein